MKVNCSIIVEQTINITQFIQQLPTEFIPISIEKKQIKNVSKEASQALSTLLSYPTTYGCLGISFNETTMVLRDPIRLMIVESSSILTQFNLIYETFLHLPSQSSGEYTKLNMNIKYINYIESFLKKDNQGIFCINCDGSIQYSIPSNPVIYCGTFNPLHIAHRKILEYISMRYPQRPVLLEMSQRSADKSATSITNVMIRAAQVAGQYQVIISNTSLYVDKCKYYPNATFIVGYDTAIRIVDKKYYQNSEKNLMKVMQTIEDYGCNFIVVGRYDEKMKCFLDFDSIKHTLPAKEYHHLFISLDENHFRYDMSSTYLRNHGVQLIKNVLPKL